MYELDLEKAEEPEIKLPTSVGSQKKLENSKTKTSISASLTMLKPSIEWITINCGKFFKRWEYQTTLPASHEICMQVKKQQLKPDMEQWTGCKLGKKYVKAIYCHSAYLTYMQSVSCEMPSFKPAFSLSSFTFIKRLFSSSSLSVIGVISSAYLRLLIFLLAILIPA